MSSPRQNNSGNLKKLIHGHNTRASGPSPTYGSWQAMKKRCMDPKHRHYDNYGGRGVKVCERWMIFVNFLEDMGVRPEGKTLDRYPNPNGDYEPGNVRWATAQEQQDNTRRNHVAPPENR